MDQHGASSAAGAGPPPPDEPAKKFKFPTAFTVLAAVLLLVWIASFFIPAGRYTTSPETGAPVPGTYHELPSCSAVEAGGTALVVPSPGETGTAPADAESAPGAKITPEPGVNCVDTSLTYRFKQLWNAPPNGLYGVEAANGFVGPWEEGILYGSAAIFFFVLAVGAFITVTMKTEAIQTGIGRLALRFRSSGYVLIAMLMTVFALGGTSYGMWEETLGFFVLLVPLALALNYDRMVAAAIVFLGAGSGVIGSTVNPFATGVASDAAGISIGDGIGLRIALWIVVVSLGIGYVILYARRVHNDPAKSVIGVSAADAAEAQALVEDVPNLTSRQKVVLVLFIGTFLLMIYGFIPWNDLWHEGFGKDFPLPTFSDFYFPEAAGLFLVMAVVIGLIAKLGEEGTVTTIVSGAADFIGAALIIVFARGITVVMRNSYMTDTILHWMEKAVSGSSAGVFAISAFLVNIPIAFLVPSSSGHAALVMPILAPLADFAGVSRALVVTAYQSASGFVNLVTPTSAVIMGGLALSKVGYDRYLKFVWPFLAIVFVVVCAFLGIAAAIG
jgi:uncharacterized ion transporter superfamily protein YfcC